MWTCDLEFFNVRGPIPFLQTALAWCLKNPDVSTVITGASRPEQVIENMKAPDVVPKLTESVIDQIEIILRNKPQTD